MYGAWWSGGVSCRRLGLGLGLLGSVDAVWLGDGLREKGLLVER